MGKYIRKCKAIGDVAVMEVAQVGVRMTRDQTALAMEAASSGTSKRRKLSSDGELSFSSSLVQLSSRSRILATPENSLSPATSGNSPRRTASEDPCDSPCNDHAPTSCCSSNGSSELAKESSKIADLEEESFEVQTSTYIFHCRERRDTPPDELQAESGLLESMALPTDQNSRGRPAVEKMPTEAELEEFFAAAEKDIEKRFAEKYNYDIGKDRPLEGRYEWVQIKP